MYRGAPGLQGPGWEHMRRILGGNIWLCTGYGENTHRKEGLQNATCYNNAMPFFNMYIALWKNAENPRNARVVTIT